MTLRLESPFAQRFADTAAAAVDADPVAADDPIALRAVLAGLRGSFQSLVVPLSVVKSHFTTSSFDGAEITLRWYRAHDAFPGSAVVYLHGGGMIAGSAELYEPLVRAYVEWTGVPFLSVDYRLAPEQRGEVLAEDGFAGLTWLHDHAPDLGIDPSRIAVMGDSAGGGVAAGVAILARDRSVPVARQILVYPILDDRNTTPDEDLLALPTVWSYEFNRTGGAALLGDEVGTDRVTAIAAPGRNSNFAGLAPPLSKWVSWTSSAKKAFGTRRASGRRESRRSCTSQPERRTDTSLCSSAPRWENAGSRTRSASSPPCKRSAPQSIRVEESI